MIYYLKNGIRYYKNGGLIRRMKDASGGPIHYSRTMTTDNLSKAANYVGEYVLKGLGTFGKIITAPFVQLGPTSATIYKSKKLLAKEKAIELKSEELIGKAMTWVSPLNYGAALATGNGLNARKGEEEVASWSPAWQAVGRLGELYVGPKAVKGIKATPRAVVNTAAKAGVKPAKAAVVAREIKLATKNKPNIEIPKAETRTRVGDVETDNPQLVYRQGKGITEDFIKKGKVEAAPKPEENLVSDRRGWTWDFTPQYFDSPMFAQGRPWFGSKGGGGGDLLVTAEPLSFGNANGGLVPWEGNGTFDVRYELGKLHSPVGIRRVPAEGQVLDTSNTTAYKWVPGYGYRKVVQEPSTSLAFFERKPSKNNVVGTSLDYSMKDSKGINFIKLFFALLKINGKEYTSEGLKDAKNVQQGLPEYIQSYLNLNTVERAVRAMRKNGYSEREILLYVDKVNEEMNKVKVGMYSDLDYNAAGALDFGGFYNSDNNFISVNKDAQLTKPAFTPNYIMKHEGRHLIDYNTSMTDDVINILEKAYDKDFLEIPKHEDAGNLKDYLHMDRERVTTNRDAREVLLSNLELHPGEFLNLTKFAQTSFGKNKDMIDFLNELILYAEPEDIINAVENSNGYGKRYINYLKKNNKLTTTKIEQLRLAMIHVPSYLLPVAGGYTLYNIFNQPLQQLQYLKQGGKMNIIEFLKNGSGIHIKKKNRGKFTAYCGGNVTSACIAKAKASGNPTLVKRATFAANARKWKYLHGGLFKRSNLSTGLQFAATFPFLYALGKALDPTGVSGYSDVKKADKEWENNPSFSNGYNVAIETLGALPIISTGSRIWRALLGFVTGNGFIKDYKEASNLSDLYMNELVIDYFDNTVKPRKEFEKHSQHVDYTDANHLPSPELAPKGSKVGQVINNYDYKYKDHYNYKKYVKHLKGGKLCLIPRN